MADKFYNTEALAFYGYSAEAVRALEREFEKLGFRYKEGQFGGGPEILRVIAQIHLSLDSVAGMVTIGLVTNLIYDLLKKTKNWLMEQKHSSEGTPIMMFYVYSKKDFRVAIRLDLDKEYSSKDIEKKIKREGRSSK